MATPGNAIHRLRKRAQRSAERGGQARWRALLLLVLLTTACARPAVFGAGAALPPEAEALYVQYCAECHGVKGEGQLNWKRPNAEGVYPAPPHDNSGHTWHHADDQLLAIIAQGGTLPNSQMPAFDTTLTAAEMELVLAYIRTFWGQQERAFQEQVTRQSHAR